MAMIIWRRANESDDCQCCGKPLRQNEYYPSVPRTKKSTETITWMFCNPMCQNLWLRNLATFLMAPAGAGHKVTMIQGDSEHGKERTVR